MNQITTYLTFSGNCREAMEFYRYCLGGDLSFQSLGDSVGEERLPDEMSGYVLHATLRKDRVVLMGTDMVGEEGLHRGNAVSILVECSHPEELHAIYSRLSENGSQDHPVVRTNHGSLFGGLTDKYGNRWLLHCGEQGGPMSQKNLTPGSFNQ